MASPSRKAVELAFLSPAQEADELGRLGPYRILQILGKGGMGVVLKAEEPSLQRTVALKVMLPELAKKQSARERFLREARAAAAIEHDHIIPIYQVGEDRGVPFIAMPFLKGMNLEDYLKKKGNLTVPQILRIGREVCKGLAAAHSQGMIHRDIKPGNLWLDANAQGRVKILDFGLARPAREDTQLTQDGAIIGTPAYMAPEQAAGKNVDARSDIFSVGAVLYQLCTGRKPFGGDNMLAILNALATETPKHIRELNPGVPGPFADLIMRLLEKDPDKRPASARSVADSIQLIEKGKPASKVEVPVARPAAAIPVGTPPSPPTPLDPGSYTHVPLPAQPTLAPVHTPHPTPQPPSYPGLDSGFPTDDDINTLAGPPSAARKNLKSRPRSVWSKYVLGGGVMAVALLALLVLLFTGSSKGTLEIEAQDSRYKLLLVKDGKIQQEIDPAQQRDLQLVAGNYQLRFKESVKGGLTISPASFTLKENGKQLVKIARPGLPPPPPIHTDPPPPSGDPIRPLPGLDPQKAKEIQQQWAQAAQRKVKENNSMGIQMVLIPPGEFDMGWNLDQVQQIFKGNIPGEVPNHEMPAHRVKITQGFYLSAHEITISQFDAFVKETNHITDPEKSGNGASAWDPEQKKHLNNPKITWKTPPWKPDRLIPVTAISWYDAMAFCDWLSKKEGRVYRLPTEAEWEYACKAGAATAFAFGPVIARDNQGVFGQGNEGQPSPVGPRQPNAWGLQDMHGNVHEWCLDRRTAYTTETRIDPRGRDSDPERSIRGGCFDNPMMQCRCTYHMFRRRENASATIGFRVLCQLTGGQ